MLLYAVATGSIDIKILQKSIGHIIPNGCSRMCQQVCCTLLEEVSCTFTYFFQEIKTLKKIKNFWDVFRTISLICIKI